MTRKQLADLLERKLLPNIFRLATVYNYSGFCLLILILFYKNKISSNQCTTLIKHVQNNRPTYFTNRKYYDKRYKNSAFYWQMGDWDIRKAWLEDEIKKLRQ